MRWIVVLLGVALAATACDNETPRAGQVPPDTRPQWSPPDAYTYEVESSCGERNFIGRFRIYVDTGDVRAVTALDRSARVAIDIQPQDIPTLEVLLAEASEARRAGADHADVRWDDQGRPRRIEIDYDTDAIDDEACYVVRRFAPIEAASITSTHGEIYEAVIRRVIRETAVGRPAASLDGVYVVDGTLEEAGSPRADVFVRPRSPFEGTLVNEITQQLAPQRAPLRLVRDMDVAVRDPGTGTVGNDTAVLVLGEIERRGDDKARVPITWWCDKCSLWLTYVVVERDGRWVVTGTTGRVTIS